MTPRVSVVIPCYNAASYLGEALESVRAQSRAADEVLVIDDGSTDDSHEVALIAGVDVLRHQENRGPGAALNTGLNIVTGDYVAILAADDVWDHDHIATLARLLDEHPEAAVAFSAMRLAGDRSGEWRCPHAFHRPAWVWSETFATWIRIPASAVLLRRALTYAVRFDERREVCPDYEFWCRVALTGRAAWTQRVTATYRQHAQQITRKRPGTYRLSMMVDAQRRIIDDLRHQRDPRAEILAAQAETQWGSV